MFVKCCVRSVEVGEWNGKPDVRVVVETQQPMELMQINLSREHVAQVDMFRALVGKGDVLLPVRQFVGISKASGKPYCRFMTAGDGKPLTGVVASPRAA